MLLPFCLSLLTAVANGQGVLRCGDTTFWVITGNERGFAVQLEGDVGETDNDNLINVENKVLHYLIIDAESYHEAGSDNSPRAILERFINGEVDVLKLDGLHVVKDLRVRPDGKEFLLWRHDWQPVSEVEIQVHGTILIGNTVVWLTSPKFKWLELADVEPFMLKAIESVREIESTENLCP